MKEKKKKTNVKPNYEIFTIRLVARSRPENYVFPKNGIFGIRNLQWSGTGAIIYIMRGVLNIFLKLTFVNITIIIAKLANPPKFRIHKIPFFGGEFPSSKNGIF